MLMRTNGENVPSLNTELPGPDGKALIAADEQVTSPSYTRDYPLTVARGSGSTIEDLDGNLFLDFTAGIAVCSTGHCHPRIVKAIQQQAERLIHMSGTDFYYGPQAELAKKLASIMPGDGDKRVFFTNSGAESVEAAFKLARYHTGRHQLIAFRGAFHGRTLGALSLTGSKIIQREGFAPLVPGVTHIGYPNCLRCPLRSQQADCCYQCFDELETLFATTVSPREVAAIVVEPIQGEGGYIVPPADFHPRLKAIAEEHGILYVVDEVQAGMGRTGKMLAIEHWGVEPDIICLAKGIASGMPLGAVVARAEVMNWPPGSHASTFGGNPVSCAAALETIALLEEELIENAAVMGRLLHGKLEALCDKHPTIAEVRGKGLMIGVELVADQDSLQPAADLRNAVVNRCFEKGLLLLGCGTNSVRFSPPLIIGKPEIETAVRIFSEALGELETAAKKKPLGVDP